MSAKIFSSSADKHLDNLVYFMQQAQQKQGLDPLFDNTDVVTVANSGVSAANILKGAISVFARNPLSAVVEFGSAGLLRMNNREYKRQLQKFAEENAKLKQEREKFAEENGKLKQEREEFSKENGKLAGHVDNLQAQVGHLSRENAQLRTEVETLIMQVDRFVRENDALGARNETYARNNQTLQDRVTELDSLIKNGDEMVGKLHEEVTSLKVERAAVRAQLDGTNEALTKARDEVSRECRKLAEIRDRQEAAQARFEASNAFLAQNVRAFAAENRRRQQTQPPVVFVVNAANQNGAGRAHERMHVSHHQALLDTSLTA